MSWFDPVDSKRWRRPFFADGGREVYAYLSARITIHKASGVVFRRSASPIIDDLIDMQVAGDWITWSRLLRKGGQFYSPEPLNHFRMHKSTQRFRIDLARQCEEEFRAVSECLPPAPQLTCLAVR